MPQPRNTFPCGMCERHVSCTDARVACDDCSVWYHKTCIELCTADYDLLDRSSVQWICHKCDSINCNTFTFRSLSLLSANFYLPLSEINGTESVDSFCATRHSFSPLKTSSPKAQQHGRINGSVDQPFISPERTNPCCHSQQYHSSPHRCKPVENRLRGSNSSSTHIPHKKQNLRILNINCQSIVNKRAKFSAMVNYVKPDVIFGKESLL